MRSLISASENSMSVVGKIVRHRARHALFVIPATMPMAEQM